MKKITSKNFSKRLIQYSALSVAALGVSDAAGQIVYTDVDPDATIAVGEEFSVDFNGDFLENLSVNNPGGLAGGNAAIVFPSSGGAFVGFTAGGFEYPALLAEGDPIDDASGYTTTGVRGDLNYYGCAYSNSQWCDAVVDGYLGVRFVNLTGGGDTHYGWVRLDTDVGGTNNMVVKDFAFNGTPDTAINAGDTGALATEDQYFKDFVYFVDANNQLNLRANAPMENLQLVNIIGQEVISQKLTNSNEIIDISNLKSGIYIASVSINGNAMAFKIVRK